MNRKPSTDEHTPPVRIGQGEYARELLPGDDPPKAAEGGIVGVLIIALFYFILGFILGACLC